MSAKYKFSFPMASRSYALQSINKLPEKKTLSGLGRWNEKEISCSHKIFYYFYSFNLNFNWIFAAFFFLEWKQLLAGKHSFTQNNRNQMENCTFTSEKRRKVIFPGATATNVFLPPATVNSGKSWPLYFPLSSMAWLQAAI